MEVLIQPTSVYQDIRKKTYYNYELNLLLRESWLLIKTNPPKRIIPFVSNISPLSNIHTQSIAEESNNSHCV